MKVSRVLGYTSALGVAPGEELTAHLHSPGPVEVRLVQLASDLSAMAGYASAIDGTYEPGEPKLAAAGSYMKTASGALDAPLEPVLSIWIWPTAPQRGDVQAIICWGSEHGLFLDAQGRVEARWGTLRCRSATPVLRRRWTRLTMTVAHGELMLGARTRDGFETRDLDVLPVSGEGAETPRGDFRIAASASAGSHQHCFDGKIAQPDIGDGTRQVARWNFASSPASARVPDDSGNGFDGILVNHPQRGMTGPDWRGNSTGWTEAPDEYDAIAFHRDDLSDARWPETFRFIVPDDMPSGAYGFALTSAGERDVLPFFVTPAARAAKAPLAFIVPTFSYLAYANERHWWSNPGVEAIAGAPLDDIVGPMERWAEQHELLSLYDYHSDGTGSAHASLLRPLVNVRPDYVHPLLRGPHQLSGDILTIEWLRAIGQRVDFVTDHWLHERGAGALDGYRCVMTGSHPEYASSQILDALEGYLSGGGRIMHLGGNAFYFVTSLFADAPHVAEVRRGAVGTIPWQSEPGEWRQASTGEPSGMWRWRGRSAHALVCTGTSAVSFGPGEPFVRDDSAAGAAIEWIFEGVESPSIMAHGTLSGGPAGFEVDSMRYELGTPADATCLASATDFGEMCFLACEDSIGTGPLAVAQCDLAYRELASGGAVFSAPSISWTSCLPANGGANPIAAITGNVLRRFVGEPILEPSPKGASMSDSETAINQVLLSCSPGEAFAAWIDPAIVPQWLAPPPYSMVGARIDAKQNGHYEHDVRGPDGDHLVTGEFAVFKPGKALRKSWRYSGPNPAPKPGATFVDVTFEVIDGEQTRVTVRHSNLRDREEYNHYALGWGACLQRLSEYFSKT